jgi:aspartate aminotransferase
MGAEFLARYYKASTVYLPVPTWANHKNIFNDAGFTVADYPYYYPPTRGLDLQGMLDILKHAPEKSIILMHSCAHNPTGVDPTPEQWKEIAGVIKERALVPFFDCAYQGFASGDLNRDAWSVRYFVEQGIELLVAQSYSKNFGLYNERCGCLTVACQSSELAANVKSQLNKITRPLISNPPAFGARIVSKILNSPELYEEWTISLKEMAGRINKMRQMLFDELQRLKTPGSWQHILDQIGMFTFTGLTVPQSKMMTEKFHIYLTDNGRISMAGLTTKNVVYFAESMDHCVRNS